MLGNRKGNPPPSRKAQAMLARKPSGTDRSKAYARMMNPKVLAVARRSIMNKLPMAYIDQDESNPADSWLDLDEVAVALGESEADTYARHLNGSPPHFQERYIAADREFRLQCSLETLTLHLIEQATR